MRLSELKDLKNLIDASDSLVEDGQALIYTRQNRPIFEHYQNLKQFVADKKLEELEILEIHLFDDEHEYRAIETKSHAHKTQGIIEHVVSDDLYKKNEKYIEEKVLLEVSDEKIAVVNYLEASESGMLSVIDYRLRMEV